MDHELPIGGAAAGVVAVGGALLLVAAGIGHLRRPWEFRAVLRAQRLLPQRLCGPLATVFGAAELLVGAIVLAALGLAPAAAVPPLIVQTGVYAVFTGYLAVLKLRRPNAPCGCFGPGDPVTWLACGRAALLAVGTAGAGLLDADLAAMPMAARLLCLAGGTVVAMVAWLVPALAGLARPTPAD